jgi:hypothetical protein
MKLCTEKNSISKTGVYTVKYWIECLKLDDFDVKLDIITKFFMMGVQKMEKK